MEPSEALYMEAANNMAKPKAEWDPSWDDDWQNERLTLAEGIVCKRPRTPAETVEAFRSGCGPSKYHPREQSDVEAQMYEEYMAQESEEDVESEFSE
jgi:hypothetical protein